MVVSKPLAPVKQSERRGASDNSQAGQTVSKSIEADASDQNKLTIATLTEDQTSPASTETTTDSDPKAEANSEKADSSSDSPGSDPTQEEDSITETDQEQQSSAKEEPEYKLNWANQKVPVVTDEDGPSKADDEEEVEDSE